MTHADRPAGMVAGWTVRTCNADEADPGRGRIAGLWQRVMAGDLAERLVQRAGELPHAVYHGYEDDQGGACSLTVGWPVAVAEQPEGVEVVAVPPARCALFGAEGAMPAALIAQWQEVWRRSAAGELARAFTVDVEVHEAPDRAVLWIALA